MTACSWLGAGSCAFGVENLTRSELREPIHGGVGAMRARIALATSVAIDPGAPCSCTQRRCDNASERSAACIWFTPMKRCASAFAGPPPRRRAERARSGRL